MSELTVVLILCAVVGYVSYQSYWIAKFLAPMVEAILKSLFLLIRSPGSRRRVERRTPSAKRSRIAQRRQRRMRAMERRVDAEFKQQRKDQLERMKWQRHFNQQKARHARAVARLQSQQTLH